MNIRKVRRKCSVRGCKNTDCFAISKVREVGNSVIICSDCLKEGLEAVEEYVPEVKKPSAPPPSLFFNSSAADNAEETTAEEKAAEEEETTEAEEEQEAEDNTEAADGEAHICEVCGKEFKSASGLARHKAVHDKGGDVE